MKKQFTILLSLIFILGLAPVNFSNAKDLADTLKGKILLQVESKGEAWYVNPDNSNRYYLGRPTDAFRVMRELGLGISNKDFDSFGDKAPARLSGKILLKVEDGGKAYYVNPVDLKLYFLGRPDDAFKLMRELGLGIKNNDLDKITNNDNNLQLKTTPEMKPISSINAGDIKEKIKFVVQIICPVNGGTNSGTGSVIYGNSNTNSKILTNKHVLEGATGQCSIYRTQNYEDTPVLYFNSNNVFVFSKDYDLAIITPDVETIPFYIDTNFKFNLNTDIFNKSILTLGYPNSAGNNITLSKGVVGGSENIAGVTMYKTDAKIDSGNSGGAIFDENGQFVGVPTLASQGNFSSYGYIIPAQIVKNFVDIVEQEGYIKQNWQHPQLSLYVANPSNTILDIVPTPQNSAPQTQEDPSIKIAKCQAETKISVKILTDPLYKQAEDGFGENIAAAENGMLKAQKAQYGAIMEITPEELRTLSPEQQNSIRQSKAQSYQLDIDYYSLMKQKNLKLLEEQKNKIDTFADQAYNDLYLKCLNK